MKLLGKVRHVEIEDFDSIIEIESDIENMKTIHNYWDGLKFALTKKEVTE